MSKLYIQEDTLTAIGDAIRAKTGTEDLIAPGDMPAVIESISGGSDPVIEGLDITANGTYEAPEGVDGYNPITVNVPQDGAPSAEELTISGSARSRFDWNGWNWFIEKYGSQITTSDIGDATEMFGYSSTLVSIPFVINMSGSADVMDNMFVSCYSLQEMPMIYGAQPKDMKNMFQGCHDIITFPDGFADDWDWSLIESYTDVYTGAQNGLFNNCYRLRQIPTVFFEHGNPQIRYSYVVFRNAFSECQALDEVIGLPNPHTAGTYAETSTTRNIFADMFKNCYRLKNFTFAEMDPPNWAYQTLDLSTYVGYCSSTQNFAKQDWEEFREGMITLDKEVTDDATYQALKDDPDWFTKDVAYSRYNHDSAVATINSLPDCSAYQTENSLGANIIKFKGEAGSATDGGAINTLTEEEIAVATAKGWTVELV